MKFVRRSAEVVNSYKIVFMGTPEFAVPALKVLMEGPNQVVAVVTQPDRPKGRGRKLMPSPIKVLAEKADIAVLQPEKARSPEFLCRVRDLAPDLLVVAAYGQILPQELLDIPRIMPINVHGSLLPEYRGAAPIQWAIIQGDTETGITIMEMDAGMDTGPMLLQKALTIGPEETLGELYERMSELGARLLVQALDELHKGTLKPRPQPEEGISYAPPIKPEMARLDWSQPARRISCMVWAFDPRPGAYTLWKGQRLRLYMPFVLDMDAMDMEPGTVCRVGEDGVMIATGKGCLGIRELQWPGKRRMPCAEFLRGRPIPVGAKFES
ncbi:MAG: methionyl-tRNA formyltransferase [Deltaproteobacteria bacterium]|nr:methionyl-tRNA formyltransferase [Deltaproteobacteria bacterium]